MGSFVSHDKIWAPGPLQNGMSGRSASGFSHAAKLLTAILAGLAGMSAASAQPIYSVTNIGVLPGCTNSNALNLNDQGDVVGYCGNGPSLYNAMAFVWRKGSMTALGKLTGGIYSEATAINSAGKITGTGDTGNMRPQAWVTGPNGLLNIFPNNSGNTRTVFIGENGVIGGYYMKSSRWTGAIWTPDPKDPRKYRLTDLPVLAGGSDPLLSSALPGAFNESGQAAGYTANDQIGHHAAFWNNDPAHSIVDLGVYASDWGSLANGMNDAGQVVGDSQPPFASRPVLWNNDAAHAISELPYLEGDNCGSAVAINNIGHVLGMTYVCVPGSWDSLPPRFTVWRDGGVYDLQTSLDTTTGAGWKIIGADAINNVGQIAAIGILNGEIRGLLLTPLAP